jgi:hypothetical protein
MREGEPGALTLLQKHRAEVLDPAIAKHRGSHRKIDGRRSSAGFIVSVPALGEMHTRPGKPH